MNMKRTKILWTTQNNPQNIKVNSKWTFTIPNFLSKRKPHAWTKLWQSKHTISVSHWLQHKVASGQKCTYRMIRTNQSWICHVRNLRNYLHSTINTYHKIRTNYSRSSHVEGKYVYQYACTLLTNSIHLIFLLQF